MERGGDAVLVADSVHPQQDGVRERDHQHRSNVRLELVSKIQQRRRAREHTEIGESSGRNENRAQGRGLDRHGRYGYDHPAGRVSDTVSTLQRRAVERREDEWNEHEPEPAIERRQHDRVPPSERHAGGAVGRENGSQRRQFVHELFGPATRVRSDSPHAHDPVRARPVLVTIDCWCLRVRHEHTHPATREPTAIGPCGRRETADRVGACCTPGQ